MTDDRLRRRARDEFRALLERATQEHEWQRFFTENPFVLSESLPLRLDPQNIIPLGRPGETEPDFIFYPTAVQPIPYHGVIEIKRPTSQIVSVTRKNVAVLSRDAETAIQQSRAYLRDGARYFPRQIDDSLLFLGNRSYVFVIMGRSAEIVAKLGQQLFREMIEERLPGNLRILPYDYLLQVFENRLPPPIHFLRVFSGDEEEVEVFVSGSCLRCGDPAVIESATCVECGTIQYPASGVATEEGEGDFRIEIPHPNPVSKHDLDTAVDYECQECDSTRFEIDFERFCDYCAYQWDKLSRE